MVTGQKAAPKTPVAMAPADWRYAKTEPASATAIAEWAAAATLPAATPLDVNPTADRAAVLPTAAVAPPPTAVATAVYPTALSRHSA